MAWSAKTKATPANIRKRIDAAIEALDGATTLLDKSGDTSRRSVKIGAEIRNARAWAVSASNLTRKR